MTIRLAIFDCDGTLVDGQAGICNAMDAAFSAAGLAPPGRHEVRRAVGLSLPLAIRGLLPDADEDVVARIDQAYRHAFQTARASGQLVEPLYDGIATLLPALREAGWVMGVATGKSQRGLEHCLAMHGLTAHFATLQTADHHPSKPHPSMLEAAMAETGASAADCVMIGDTTYDMAMAGAAGVRALGVDWGYHSAEELRGGGAEAVATSIAELKELLLR